MSLETERRLMALAAARPSTVRAFFFSSYTRRVIGSLPEHLLLDIGYSRNTEGVVQPVAG